MSVTAEVKSQSQHDTVYLCLRYRNINRNGLGFTGTDTDFERIFFVADGKRRIFLGQPNNYFQNYNFRYIRLLIPKDSSVSAAIQITKRPNTKKKNSTRHFDTVFTVRTTFVRPQVIAFTHNIYSSSRSFDFVLINQFSKEYKRVQNELHEKRVIAEYNYTTKRVNFLQPAGRLFIE